MSDKLADVFRQNVRSRMIKLGVTQVQMAQKIGVTQSHVNQLLTGHRNPGLQSLEQFAAALETTAADLLKESKLSRSA